MQVASFTGWSPETVRNEMDIPRLEALQKVWEEVPALPVQLRRVAKFLGLPGPEKPKRAGEASADIAKSLFGGQCLSKLPDDPALKFFEE
jgi:hypothetical protein